MCGAVCVILDGWSREIWREVVLFVLWGEHLARECLYCWRVFALEWWGSAGG